jgi:hypothetical protein
VAPSVPAVVRSREELSSPPSQPAPGAPIAATSGTATGVVVRELIFKGTPPPIQSRWSGRKLGLWLGLGLGVVAGAVLVCLYAIRHAAESRDAFAARKEDLRMPSELLFKEPMNLSQGDARVKEP